MSEKLKIVFMGTPEFAAVSLKKLIDEKYDVEAVFTQPDKPKGRGYKMIPSAVKVEAVNAGIEVYQPISLRKGEDAEKSLEVLNNIKPDIIIVVAYGQILPKEVLDIPRLGCVNIHGSILPEYRGAAPIERAVLDGKKITGVTSMYMAEGLDTGDMLIKKTTEIGENETAPELRARLAEIGADVLVETIEGLEKGTIKPEPQNDSESTYAAKITKEMSKLDFTESAVKLHNIIRAITGFTMLDGKRFKIGASEVVDKTYNEDAGTVADTDNFIVVCGDKKGLKLLKVQPEGKKMMNTADYLRGKKLEKNTKLG
ncbi:MAG: methionyl-tRNA formyltransferase [Oscillospiraceae bacterium]|nr:methionyl-tRNA formyltransferase [Oscillospiraceae bacterium]